MASVLNAGGLSFTQDANVQLQYETNQFGLHGTRSTIAFNSTDTQLPASLIATGNISLSGHSSLKASCNAKQNVKIGKKDTFPSYTTINTSGSLNSFYPITMGISGGDNAVPNIYTNIVPTTTSELGNGLIVSVEIHATGKTVHVTSKGEHYQVGDTLTVSKTHINADTDLSFTVQSYFNGGYPVILFGADTVLDATYGNQSGNHKKGTIISNGDMYSDSLGITSDVRFKKNIVNITDAQLDLLHCLLPSTYNWILPEKDKDRKFGLLAQEVQVYYPQIVNELTKDHLTLDYVQLIPLLVKECQHIKRDIEYSNLLLENYNASTTLA